MILASKSPRRKEILEMLGFNIEILTRDIEEISNKATIREKIEDIARKKVLCVAQERKEEFVVGADTVVVIDNEILGKPKDRLEAKKMLEKLSGRVHEVITAFTLINIEKNIEIVDSVVTEVRFYELSEEKIQWYLDTGEPFDKAGAYGIQGKGATLVEEIKGDFFSVMGFPVSKFIKKLDDLEIKINEI